MTTVATQVCLSDSLIQTLDCWNLAAFLDYIRSDQETLNSIQPVWRTVHNRYILLGCSFLVRITTLISVLLLFGFKGVAHIHLHIYYVQGSTS